MIDPTLIQLTETAIMDLARRIQIAIAEFTKPHGVKPTKVYIGEQEWQIFYRYNSFKCSGLEWSQIHPQDMKWADKELFVVNRETYVAVGI